MLLYLIGAVLKACTLWSLEVLEVEVRKENWNRFAALKNDLVEALIPIILYQSLSNSLNTELPYDIPYNFILFTMCYISKETWA